METKICSRCKKELPMTKEYFYVDKRKSLGFRYECKKCSWTSTPEGKSQKKLHYLSRKDFYNQKSKEWKRNHPEIIKASNYKYRSENKEQDLLSKANYRNNNRELIRKKSSEYYYKNKAKCLKASLKWIKEHRDVCTLATQKYRNTKLKLESTLTITEWEKIKKDFNYLCAYCGKKRKLEQEHFVAVSNEGPYTLDNILPSCRSCNSSKNNKDFFEWYPTYKYYSEEREQKIVTYLELAQKVLQVERI